MGFLDIGPGELILIFVIGLIIFGPGKLPEFGVSVARAIREFQRASSELTTEINRQIDEAENRRIMEQHPNPPVEAEGSSGATTPIPAVVSSEAPHLEPILPTEPADATLALEPGLPEPPPIEVSSNGQLGDGPAGEAQLASTEIVTISAEAMGVPASVMALPAEAPPTQLSASPPPEDIAVTPVDAETAPTVGELTTTDLAPSAVASTEPTPAADAADQPARPAEAAGEPASTVDAVEADDSADGPPTPAETKTRRYRARQGRQHVGQSPPTNG